MEIFLRKSYLCYMAGMKFILHSGLSLLMAGLILVSCKDIKSYPDVPEVKFKEFRYEDTTLVISFIDGDGDFGIPAGYMDPPFDTGGAYYFNVFFTFEQKVDTGYVRVPMADYSYWNLRVEDVPQPQGQNKTMFGDIELMLVPILGSRYVYPDTFRFTFYLYDFALHRSNTGVSPPLTFKGR